MLKDKFFLLSIHTQWHFKRTHYVGTYILPGRHNYKFSIQPDIWTDLLQLILSHMLFKNGKIKKNILFIQINESGFYTSIIIINMNSANELSNYNQKLECI